MRVSVEELYVSNACIILLYFLGRVCLTSAHKASFEGKVTLWEDFILHMLLGLGSCQNFWGATSFEAKMDVNTLILFGIVDKH